jgi:hypothetical protein
MTAAEPVRAGHRAWLGLAVLALPCLAGWSPLLIASGGLAVGGAFLQRQRILPDSSIDLRLFRAPVFRSSSERLPTQLRGGPADAGPIPAQHRSWARSPS